jgi:uncharacterized protein (TIGR02246 family)
MKSPVCSVVCLAALVAAMVLQSGQPVGAADESPETAALQAAAETFVKGFNAGKADAVAAQFLPQGELIDEEGQIYQGREELEKLFAAYFAKFPGATLGLEIESMRTLGANIAIEEGTRFLSSKDDANAQVRYVAVWTKSDDKWLIASIREFYDEPLPTPNERLQMLAWLVGDWVSENADGAVKISYRWSDDKNFLLGDFDVTRGGEVLMKSTQRIGWDPVAGKVRSWLFDADGGFADGCWTPVEGGWVIKSSATAPDGGSGSATISVSYTDKDHFTLTGTERVTGDGRQDDFEVSVARQPPAPEAEPAAPAKPSNRAAPAKAPGAPKAAAPKAKTAPPAPKR